jgi:hypothetical protein
MVLYQVAAGERTQGEARTGLGEASNAKNPDRRSLKMR